MGHIALRGTFANCKSKIKIRLQNAQPTGKSLLPKGPNVDQVRKLSLREVEYYTKLLPAREVTELGLKSTCLSFSLFCVG